MNSFSTCLSGIGKYFLILAIVCCGSSGWAQQYHDVALQSSVSAAEASPGDTVTFTIRAINQSHSALTSVGVQSALPANASYVSYVAAAGTAFDPVTGVWWLGNALTATTDFLELSIKAVLTGEGVAFHKAEVFSLHETDGDSKPGNHSLLEDDMAGACVSVPWYICAAQNQKVTLTAPAGLSGYAWFRDAGSGPQMVSDDSIFIANAAGRYTYSATLAACAMASCCPVIVKELCPGDYDLSLEKTLAPGQPSQVDIGDEVSYLITATNEGNAPAFSVEITDHVPAGLALSPDNPGWSLMANGEAVFTLTQPLQPGESFTIEIKMTVVYGASGQTIANVAEVTGATDEDGIAVTDVDSTPGNGSTGEDDLGEQDITLVPHDPTGYIYCDRTGKIIPGGAISVSGPGQVYIVHDGSQGYYEFYTDGTPGLYSLSYSHPAGFPMSVDCLPQPTPFDPTGLPSPVILGSDTLGMFLANHDCAVNPFFLSFESEPGDPLIKNNNLPLRCSSIASMVCADEDHNDQHDGTEPGLPGITVLLYNCADTLNPIMTTVTDADGNYNFDGLPGGNYVVQFVLPAGVRFIQNSPLSADGFTDCITLAAGQTDTTLSACIYSCPAVNAGNDAEVCFGETTQLLASVPYGEGDFTWTPAGGLSDAAISNPIANPSASTIYVVTYDDGLGCQSSDEVAVNIRVDCPGDILPEDSLTLTFNCDVSDPAFCFNIPYVDLPNYEFELNGSAYTGEFDICDYLQGSYYAYASLLGFGSGGPYLLEYWSVQGAAHSVQFETIADLVALMNQWDTNGNWTFNADTKTIYGGDGHTFYSKMYIRQIGSGAVAVLDLNRSYALNNTSIPLAEGENLLVITRLEDGTMDTVHIFTACVTPDYVDTTIIVEQTTTICFDSLELQGGVVSGFNACPEEDSPAEITFIPGTTCVEITGISEGETNACIVLCDSIGVCDTTYLTVHVNSDSTSTDGLIIYNGVSPNGDDINDYFVIKGLDLFPKHKLMIFNRWGNRVRDALPYRNDWNGYWHNKKLPFGTYFYLLDLNGDGKKYVSGYLFLMW